LAGVRGVGGSHRKQLVTKCFIVLYGCEALSPTLREELRLRVFENRVLRGIYGAKGEEVVGGWRRLHNEEPHNLCASSDILRVIKSRRMSLIGDLSHMGETRNAYKISVRM
jgi:hypothetical protein